MSEHDELHKGGTAKRRTALILEILGVDISVAEAARKRGFTVAEIEGWNEQWSWRISRDVARCARVGRHP